MKVVGVAERANVKNWQDALAGLGYLLFCLTLLLSAGFMIFEIVEYARVEGSALGFTCALTYPAVGSSNRRIGRNRRVPKGPKPS
jgi:heme/copper-type cytochrome/quinol oxidase subunit 3